ncbi:MAG: hypothetical protein FWF70_01255 [Bacteroidetes bacterium]|nr:hypothetical protein [Bacteroidota bacterium]MCL1967969.1 hypothetical protein [Bacteroidota bacterium]
MYINSLPESGNHGRNSADNQPVAISNLVSSTLPQQSTRGFVSPSATPIKKSPDITDIIVEKTENRKQKAEVEETNIAHEILRFAQNDKNNHLSLLPSSGLPVSEKDTPATFQDHWHTMFGQVFASVPTIYFPLKEYLPEIENNIIKVTVKNDVQKEHFEAKTREVLEYLRTHYDEQIEDIVVKTDEKMVTKKIIYDVKDKLQNFKEQNEEFDEFLQILELQIKD